MKLEAALALVNNRNNNRIDSDDAVEAAIVVDTEKKAIVPSTTSVSSHESSDKEKGEKVESNKFSHSAEPVSAYVVDEQNI